MSFYNDFDIEIDLMCVILWMVDAIMTLLVWTIVTITTDYSGGWYITGIMTFLVASVIWVINPIYQHYVGLQQEYSMRRRRFVTDEYALGCGRYLKQPARIHR